MSKQACSSFLLFLGALSFFLPFPAQADFVIEFSDGWQVTVGHYVDEGQTITIHTARGTIGFRKADVKQITPVSADLSAHTRLEAMPTRAPAVVEQAGTSPQQTKESTSAADNTSKSSQRRVATEGTLTKAALERLDGQYQRVAQDMDGLWEKHAQDIAAGASTESLAENRRLLQTLDQERNKLIKGARRAAPDMLPAWAQ